jgi:putative ABC transport system ATP-binding protein
MMIELAGVSKIYRRGKTEVRALDQVSLQVPEGQFLSIMGPSGSGKSTLLNLIGALDQPTTGTVRVGGSEIGRLSDNDLSRFRRERIGFVFQFFNLLPTLSAFENAMLPALLAGRSSLEMETRAASLLDAVGLGDRRDHKPDELSGGEMQRVAIARALVIQPAIVLGDEMTGNLDSRNGHDILALVRDLCSKQGLTVVMVTHDEQAAKVGDRVVRLADGKVVGDAATPKPAPLSGRVA